MRLFKGLALLTLFSVLIVVPAEAASTLYGYTRDGGGELAPTTLNIIDPATGGLISSVGLTGIGQITAAATDPTTGIVYATHGGGGCCPVAGYAGCLLTGDVGSGVVSIVGCDAVFEGLDNLPGLAINSAGDVYGMLLAANAGPQDFQIHLVSINKVSGAITLIGATASWNPPYGHGIEFGPGDVLYYQNSDDGFGTVNLGSGVFTPIGQSFTGFPGAVNTVTDMAFDASSGVMYASVVQAGGGTVPALATVDLATGEFTYVGDMPPTTNSITFSAEPPPVPTTGQTALILLGLSLLILCALAVAIRQSKRASYPIPG